MLIFHIRAAIILLSATILFSIFPIESDNNKSTMPKAAINTAALYFTLCGRKLFDEPTF
jgi:hypothetical protein